MGSSGLAYCLADDTRRSGYLAAAITPCPDLTMPSAWRATEGMGGAQHPQPRAATRAWRGWRAPHLPRNEHQGIVSAGRCCAASETPDRRIRRTRYETPAATTLTLTAPTPA